MMLAVRYSIRPCPRGCSRSGALLARRVPTMVITEDRASVKLLTASRVIEMELERIPTPALKPAKKRLAKIPIILVCTMICSLLSFILPLITPYYFLLLLTPSYYPYYFLPLLTTPYYFLLFFTVSCYFQKMVFGGLASCFSKSLSLMASRFASSS